MPTIPGSPEPCHLCAFSGNTRWTRKLEKMDRHAQKAPNTYDAAGGLKDEKKGEASQSGRLSSMSLSEEGPSVCCIDAHTGNSSIFFAGSHRRKSERTANTQNPQGLAQRMEAPSSALGCSGLAPSPQFGGRMEPASLEVKWNNFPAEHMHCVKLICGTPGEVGHLTAGTFKSNHTSSPKRRAIREFLEQIVFMVHRSPLFTATHSIQQPF